MSLLLELLHKSFLRNLMKGIHNQGIVYRRARVVDDKN